MEAPSSKLYILEFIVIKINYSQLNLIPRVLLVKPKKQWQAMVVGELDGGAFLLLTPRLCTLRRFAMTKIYVLADQPICLVWQKRWNFLINCAILQCSSIVLRSPLYDYLLYLWPFSPWTHWMFISWWLQGIY